MVSTNTIGVPANDTDFEAKCAVLFAGVVNDPTLEWVAMSGKQSGIDLIGLGAGLFFGWLLGRGTTSITGSFDYWRSFKANGTWRSASRSPAVRKRNV